MIFQNKPGERDALRPLANGKLQELGRWVVTMFVTALVAYFTAQGTINERVTRVEAKEESHFQELLRSLDRVEAELIRLRSAVK